MKTKKIDPEAVAKALLMGDVGRFEEHVLEAFNEFGHPVKFEATVTTEQGFSFVVFRYSLADLSRAASRILKKTDLKSRAYNAARIAQLLPKVKEALRAGKPSWQFAQLMSRIAGGVPTGGGKRHAEATANRRNAAKVRPREDTEAIKTIMEGSQNIGVKAISKKLKSQGISLSLDQIRGRVGRIRGKKAR